MPGTNPAIISTAIEFDLERLVILTTEQAFRVSNAEVQIPVVERQNLNDSLAISDIYDAKN